MARPSRSRWARSPAAAGINGAIVVSEPDTPVIPPDDFEPGWLWVDARSDSVQTRALFLALLRRAAHPLQQRELGQQVQQFRDISPASIANTVSTLIQLGSVARSEGGGLALTKAERAPIIHNGYLWGPAAIFGVHEQATHRRAMVLHLLRENPQGLRNIEIIAVLSKAPWVKAPCDKSSIKADLLALKDDGVRQADDGSHRWAVEGGT